VAKRKEKGMRELSRCGKFEDFAKKAGCEVNA